MENKKPKEKRRNSERRKEKSRDAARCRRSKETEIFTDLGSVLPLPASVISQLDKATIMRLTIASFKITNLLSSMDIDERPFGKEYPPNMNEICTKALDGIMLILTSDGDIIFVSENVSSYLGLSQIDLIGQSIYDFSHLCDQDELKDILTGKDLGVQKSFFIRMKCTITSKGRNVNLKSASYKVLHFTGHSVSTQCVKRELSVLSADEYDSDYESDKKTDSECKSNNSDDSKEKQISNDAPPHVFMSIAEPIPHPSNIEIPLYNESKVFVSKHSLDMKYLVADKVITKYLGYEPQSLVSKSVYDYYHTQDCNSIYKSFKILLQKGQVETNEYRFLTQGGGYVWVVTQATILNDYKGQKPETIMCINYIISGLEHGDEIYSLCQVVEPVEDEPASPEPLQLQSAATESSTEQVFSPQCLPVDSATFLLPAGDGPVHLDANELMKSPPDTAATTTATTASFFKKKPAACSESPKATTATTFAPRTKDMNKGFLTFLDDDTGLTMLKDEPDDLTHLAPTAGDVCVPLDTYIPDACTFGQLGFVVSDVIEDLILTDCSLAPFDSIPPASSMRDAYSSTSSSSPMEHIGDDQLSQHTVDLCDPAMSSLLGMDLDNGPSDLDLDLSAKNQYEVSAYEVDLYPLLADDLLWNDRSPSPQPAVVNNNNNNWQNMQDSNCGNKKDVPSTLNSETEENSASRQQHFDSGGGGGGGGGKNLMDGSPADTWGSISKMLHQRYNSGTDAKADDAASGCRTNGVKRLGPDATSAPTSWKRSKQEETAKQETSSSVLMNLLVDGCDDNVKKEEPPAARVNDGSQPKHQSRLNSSCLPDPKRAAIPSLMDQGCATIPSLLDLGNSTIPLLLDPGSATIPSLMDLTKHDYDVNAPVNERMLQGEELVKALNAGSNIVGS